MKSGQLAVGVRHTVRINPKALPLLARLAGKTLSVEIYTSSLIAGIIERSAMQILDGFEPRNRPTITKDIAVRHIAAAAIEHDITVEIEVSRLNTREISFSAICFDSSGQIGSGVHTRAFVDEPSSPR